MTTERRLAVLERSVDIDRVLRLRKLIQRDDAGRLADYVGSQIDSGLLDDEVLDAARALQANAVVIYLATLGVANLPSPNDRQRWLDVYRALAKPEMKEPLSRLDDRLPLKWIAQAVVARAPHDPDVLRDRLARCACALGDIDAALTFAFDQERLDLAQALIESLRGPSTTAQAWVHLAEVLDSRYMFYADGIAARSVLADLGACFDLLLAQLPNIAGVASVRSLLALRAAQTYLSCGDTARAIDRCRHCVDPQDRSARQEVLVAAAALRRTTTATVAPA